MELNDREQHRLVDLVNELHDAVQEYDDATVTKEVEDAADTLRDAAHELQWFLFQKLVR